MVFACRCFSFPFQFETIIQTKSSSTQTKSSSTQTFFSASSDFNPSLADSQAKASVLSNLAENSNNLRVFTFDELKAATENFCRASRIGEAEFGSVYRGVIKSLEHPFHDIHVAVKYDNGVLQGYKEWVMEVNILGVVDHPNLVKLLGYCAEDNQRGIPWLLVYEYMPNKSVEDHLSTSSEAPLSWTMRLKVAQDAARALAYLHEELFFPIIFRVFKTSSVLLDDQWNAKLSDFGLARLGPREGCIHDSAKVVETIGYAAPEYFYTGYLTSKSDVWNYGMFLYELVTGRRLVGGKRPQNKQQLLKLVKPCLGSKRFQLIVDPRLEGNYSLKSAQKLSVIANRCLSRNPKSRPKMSEVLEMVNQLIEVPSQATNPAPPLNSLVQVVAIKLKKVFMCTTQKQKRLTKTQK